VVGAGQMVGSPLPSAVAADVALEVPVRLEFTSNR
jgi:hypothetical protein